MIYSFIVIIAELSQYKNLLIPVAITGCPGGKINMAAASPQRPMPH